MAYDEMYHFNKYKETGDIRDRTKVLMALHPILSKKHKQLAGSLPDSAIQAAIAKHAVGAIDTFDPSKGAKLSTHVFNQIAQASRMNYTYQNMVRMSEDKQQGKYKYYKKALDDLSSELNRDPTDQEMAQRLNWRVREVTDLKDGLFADMYESKQEVAQQHSEFSDDKTKLNYVMGNLNPQETALFKDKTSGMTQSEQMKRHNIDINKLNYRTRNLTNKVENLLKDYDNGNRQF